MKVQTAPVGYRVSQVTIQPQEYQRDLARVAVNVLTNFYWYDIETEALTRNIKCTAGDVFPSVRCCGGWRYRARLCKRPGELCRPVTVTVVFGAGWHRPEVTTVTLWVTSLGTIHPSAR